MKYVQCVSESSKSSKTKSQRAVTDKGVKIEESSPPLFDDELNDEVSYLVIIDLRLWQAERDPDLRTCNWCWLELSALSIVQFGDYFKNNSQTYTAERYLSFDTFNYKNNSGMSFD